MNDAVDALTNIVGTEMSIEPHPNFGTGETQTSTVQREAPDPAVQRAALVAKMSEMVRNARQHWTDKAFKRMERDMAVSAGRQWPEYAWDKLTDESGERYVANITLRHIHQRTATIYGKNPKIIARRKERLRNTVWDGNMASLQQAMQAVQPAPDPLTGMPMAPDPVAIAQAMPILADATKSLMATQQNDKIARTLELLFTHEIDEQPVSFKLQMKATVRRTLTTGVGYVKLGYQRVMQKRPEVETQLRDMSNQLAAIEQLSADVADGEVAPDSSEAEQLRLAIAALNQSEEIVVREGLVFSYPNSTAIIPDPAVRQLRGFVGAGWVAEEYFLTRDAISRTYNVDVGRSATAYAKSGEGKYSRTEASSAPHGNNDNEHFCVWEIYNRDDGLVYVICDGHKDFLQEPGEPDVYLERFLPWFVLTFNDVYDEETVFPPSDVSLMFDMQMELNRSRQGLREHRRANRPRTFARSGALEEEDRERIENCRANAVIEVNGLQPQEKVQDLLQVWQGPAIDPAMYDTGPAFEDILRVVGQQEANLGGTSGATATETSIAEGSRMSAVSSNVDDLDEFLADLARSGGQVLLQETSTETVRQVVGPGAVWPDLKRSEIAKEIYLDVEAASTGRPNKAQEIQNIERLAPLLMQLPGVSPEWVAREIVRRMDDRIDISEAFASGLPSIMSMNRLQQMAPGANDPNAQGDKGATNGENPKAPQVNAAPRPADPSMMAPPQG